MAKRLSFFVVLVSAALAGAEERVATTSVGDNPIIVDRTPADLPASKIKLNSAETRAALASGIIRVDSKLAVPVVSMKDLERVPRNDVVLRFKDGRSLQTFQLVPRRPRELSPNRPLPRARARR